MKRGIIYLFLAGLAACLTGCWVTEEPEPITRIVLVDATGSIVATEYERLKERLTPIINRLARGDRMVLVPITGEPEEKLGHRILHLEMPRERVPYDANLKRAHVEALSKIQEFIAGLSAVRSTRSNVLGAIRVSAEAIKPNQEAVLICLSDMIHEYEDLRFASAAELENESTATALADRLAPADLLTRVRVRVGLLDSSDVERLSSSRRAAIRAFWSRYFKACGAEEVSITVDLANLNEGSH